MVSAHSSFPLLGSCRLTLTLMVFLGVYHLMTLRFNLSIAMVCMTNDPTDTQGNFSHESGVQKTSCPSDVSMDEDLLVVNNISLSEQMVTLEEKEFKWSKKLQGALLSSFFYGYILTQVFGGYASDKWGCKTISLIGMSLVSVGSLLLPVCARLSPLLVVGIRFIQGLASGIVFPSLYQLFTGWAGEEERATLMSVAYAGKTAAFDESLEVALHWFHSPPPQ